MMFRLIRLAEIWEGVAGRNGIEVGNGIGRG